MTTMVFNVCVRTGWMGAVAVVAASVALAACGQSGYQYLSSDDETVFAKIPDDWTLLSEGVVDFAIRPQDGSTFRVLPGDETLPWRARFTSDPSGRVRTDQLAGYIDVQPVDARMREQINLDMLLDYGDGGEPLAEPRRVRLGDLEGFRVQFAAPGDDPMVNDRLVLSDARRTVVYLIQVGCVRSCFDAHSEVIEEIMTTFTVTA
jgi:hypothetical protein